MKNLRSLITIIAVGLGVIIIGHKLAIAQENPISITVEPIVYAAVKGNADKFRALNWMKDGANGGIINAAFVKQINKDTSLEVEASGFPKTEDYKDDLLLRKGDLGFLRINYKSFRKYYDNKGGVYSGQATVGTFNGTKAQTPDSLQMDISFFKLEAGLGSIDDPNLDVAYEHNAKDGSKSLLQWTPVYFGSGSGQYRKIGPSWETVDSTIDTITLKEKKEIGGITIKGEQRAEIDYNHNFTTMQYLGMPPVVLASPIPNQRLTQESYPDAKLFGSGVRVEKWMFNDKTFAGFGYHYNHTHTTELMQNRAFNSVTGVLQGTAQQSLWDYANAQKDEHVWTGNLNTSLTPNLEFITNAKIEHAGSDGNSIYKAATAGGLLSSTTFGHMENHLDREGEHVSLRYSGIPHTSLYAEGDFEQGRNWNWSDKSSSYSLERIGRTYKESWTLGGRVVANKFFTITSQVRQRWEDNNYNTVAAPLRPTQQTFLDSLSINGEEASATLKWTPYRWLQNSFRYQFADTIFMPRETAVGSGSGEKNISKNHMLSSTFTYDIFVQPTDPLLLMLSYSHVESYVKTVAGRDTGSTSGTPNPTIPAFNSGDNSWLFSVSYSPKDNLTWTNSVLYTLAHNYVDANSGIPSVLPLGASFKELDLSTGLEYTVHKWLTIKPGYEYASYRDNPSAGAGNYSANIFKLSANFKW